MTGRGGRRRNQLLNDIEETGGYCNLKEEALDRTLRRTCFVRCHWPVVRRYDNASDSLYSVEYLRDRVSVNSKDVEGPWRYLKHCTCIFGEGLRKPKSLRHDGQSAGWNSIIRPLIRGRNANHLTTSSITFCSIVCCINCGPCIIYVDKKGTIKQFVKCFPGL